MSAENNCTFIGRISSDIKSQTIGQAPNAFTKINFSMAIHKKLSKAEAQLKAQGQPVKDAYFINCESVGTIADIILKHFAKGSPIGIQAIYDEYTYTDQQGQKKYGHKFIVDGFAFLPQNSQNNTGAAPAQNYQQNQSINNNINNNGGFQVPADDIPF